MRLSSTISTRLAASTTMALALLFTLTGCTHRKEHSCENDSECTATHPGWLCGTDKFCFNPDASAAMDAPTDAPMTDTANDAPSSDGGDAAASDGGGADATDAGPRSCADGGACLPNAPNCDPDGPWTCFACVANDPRCKAPNGACDVTTGKCVPCVNDNQCDGGACDPRADAATHFSCVSCYASAPTPPPDGGTDGGADASSGPRGQCAPSKPYCEERKDAAPLNTCIECRTTDDCKDPSKPVCDPTTSACIGCNGDDTCKRFTATPVCAKPGGACVACTDSKTHCKGGSTPICGSDNKCHPCAKDTDCAVYGADPAVCVAGACLTNDDVIYVKSVAVDKCGAGNGKLDTPFCDLTSAAEAFRTGGGKKAIVVRGPDTVLSAANFANTVAVIGQQGARLGPVNGNTVAVVSVTSGEVTLRDLTIAGAIGPNGVGVQALGGILHMTRCSVTGNTSGISLAGAAFDITNTIVGGNRTGNAVTLGTSTGAGPKTFAFNTVADNTGAGVVRESGTGYVIANSIVTGNGAGQVSSDCVFTGACADCSATNPTLTSKFHLQSDTTACIDKATGSSPADDIDGDARPQGTASDCGADEVLKP
jgi:hypothetical protein